MTKGLPEHSSCSAVAGDGHVGPELLRLGERSPRQGLAGDAGGEAEVVLDLRARAGLTARGVGFQYKHVQPLAGGVDRGGEPGRTRSHHHHVPDLGGVDGDVEAEAVRHFGIGGVLEDLGSPADQERHVLDPDLELVEERLGVSVLLDVEVAVGMAVSGEELHQTKGAGVVARADQHRVAHVEVDQPHPAEDEGPHQQLAELGIGHDEVAELGRRDVHHLSVGVHPGGDQCPPAGEEADLPGEASRPMGDLDVRLSEAAEDDLHLPGEDDVEVDVLVALVEEHLPGLDRPPLPQPGDAGQLDLGQPGEHLRLAVGGEIGRRVVDGLKGGHGAGHSARARGSEEAPTAANGSSQTRAGSPRRERLGSASALPGPFAAVRSGRAGDRPPGW